MESKPERPEPREPVPEIPGYHIDGVVGHGATGIVYRATQLAFGRRVALKVLHPELVGRGRPIRRLQREARLGARLAHPNLVASIDMGETDGRWWHAMELVVGPSLATVIQKEGRLKERHALRLFIPLADAVGHLCEAGVVHRDIKPQNILIDPAGRPRLVDLGLAFAEGDPAMTRPGGTLGTPFYVSPEQARDPTSADVRSDIWSLGATMYHAVCGQPPFEGESIAEILSGVLYASVDDPREINPALSKGMALVLRKCLTREPDRRYGHVDELLDDLERLRERRAVKVRSAQLDPVRSAGTRRRRAVGALAVVLAAVAALLLWMRPWADRMDDAADAGGSAGWEPAEELVADVEEGRSPVGAALRALAELERRVPAEHARELERARARLFERLERALAARRSEVSAKVEQAEFRKVGFVAATEAIDAFVPRLREELGLDDDQIERALEELDLDDARERVAAALADGIAARRKLVVDHYDKTVGRSVERAVAAGRWRDAQRMLVTDADAWIRDRFDFPGFPEAAVDGLVSDVAALVITRQAARLAGDWRELDRELAGFVASEESALRAALAETAFPGGPAAELERRFDAYLALLGVERDQMLVDVSRRALDALEAGRRRLEQRATELTRRDAERFLAECEEEARPLIAARAFGELRRYWAERAKLELLSGQRERLRLLQREAELLERLLLRAARGVEDARNERVEFFHKSLLVRGRLTLVGDPLTDGFRVEFGASGNRYRLRPASAAGDASGEVLGVDALETFAGLPREPDEEHDPELRLARALLRHHEGDPAFALRLLQGPRPRGLDARLADELEASIRSALERGAAEREQALDEAQRIVRSVRTLLGGERHPQDVENALRQLDRLRELSYLEWVQERKDEVRELEAQLRAVREPDVDELFRTNYAPTTIRFEQAEVRVRMTFEFGRAGGRSNERVGTWQRPPFWSHESVYGWRARDRAELEALTDGTRWPRLILRPPLDVASNDRLEVAFRLRQLSDSGPPKLLLLSVAGWHVALASRGHEGHASRPRWYTATGAPEALRELLADVEAARGRPFPGLEVGRTYDVRVALAGGRGRLELEVHAIEDLRPGERTELVFSGSMQRPAPELDEPGTQSLVVRSLEPVRLERVAIHGDYVP